MSNRTMVLENRVEVNTPGYRYLDTFIGAPCEVLSPQWPDMPAVYAYRGPETDITGEAEYSLFKHSDFNGQRVKVAGTDAPGPDWIEVPRPGNFPEFYAAGGILRGFKPFQAFYMHVGKDGKAIRYLERRDCRFKRDVLDLLLGAFCKVSK